MIYAFRWAIPCKAWLSMDDAPCRAGRRRRHKRGYYPANYLLASYMTFTIPLQLVQLQYTVYYLLHLSLLQYANSIKLRLSATVYDSLCLFNLLNLLLLLILYIDFLQMHSRHKQTYIFSHCFKQSEYSTAERCIESHPTYIAG